jgi:sortase A
METQTPRRRARLVRWLADVLLIAGGIILAYPFWSAGYAQVQQARLDTAYQRETSDFSAAAAVDSPPRGVSEAERLALLAAVYERGLRPGDPVGRLRIPSIGLSRVVQQGAPGLAALDPEKDDELLRNGPVHYGITPLPGAGEPFAVSGHRTTYGAPFRRLDRLERGDRIWMDTPYGRFRYSVVKVTETTPGDIGVLRDRGYGLVLTTCTPPYSAARRLIVWGALDAARVKDR